MEEKGEYFVELNKKTLRNLFFVASGCIVLYWLLHETERLTSVLSAGWNILSPFIIGAIIAFVLNVPMRAIERGLKGIKKDGFRRALAMLLTLLAVLLVLTGVVYLLIPQVVATVESLVAKLPDFFTRVQNTANAFLEENPQLMEWLYENTNFANINWSDLLQRAVSVVSNGLTTIMDKAFHAVISLSTGIFNGVLSFVFALYCLGRKEILARQGRRILYSFLPEKVSDETVRILRMTNSAFSNFISGQCLEAVILGVMFAISMSIFQMPYMPLVSVIIAITALVPIVGAFVGCALGAFFILVDNPMMAFWFVVMFLILQQIEGNLIYPRVVGTSIGLPGMWVLVAVAVGGDLMGVGGMLLMIPLASVLYALMRELTDKRLLAKGISSRKLQDQPPERKSGRRRERERQRQNKLFQKKLRQKENAAEHKEE